MASAPSNTGGVEGGMFIDTTGKSDWPNIQIHFTHKILGRPPAPPADAGYMIVSTLVRPKSRGYVRLHSSNPDDPPEIRGNYLTDPDDLKAIVEGIKVGRKIGRAKALDKFRGDELSPGPDMKTNDQIAAVVKATAIALYHPVGTCKMGRGHDDGAVVDAHLRVYGLESLRVVDASVMPTITSGNTNAPTIMIAERASDLIKESRKNDEEDEDVDDDIDDDDDDTDDTDDEDEEDDEGDKSLTRVLEKLTKQVGRIADAVGRGGINSFDLPDAVRSAPQMEVFVLYGEADATVREDGRGINADADLFAFDGSKVARKVLNAMTTAKNLDEISRVPKSPQVNRFDEGAVENVEPTTLKKAVWTFEDGSTITAVGKGVSHGVRLADGGASLMDNAGMTITAGTGRYAGARGTVTTNGSSYFPPGTPTPLDNPGGEITQETIEVFKIFLKQDVKA
jgi:hypothetical protein